ncbi:hypothetical protein JCM14469_39300 [Desulfatiferula olefinivorans]
MTTIAVMVGFIPLALSTCFQIEAHRFPMWHYRRDPTHVVFYRETTLRHLARHFGFRCDIPLKNAC